MASAAGSAPTVDPSDALANARKYLTTLKLSGPTVDYIAHIQGMGANLDWSNGKALGATLATVMPEKGWKDTHDSAVQEANGSLLSPENSGRAMAAIAVLSGSVPASAVRPGGFTSAVTVPKTAAAAQSAPSQPAPGIPKPGRLAAMTPAERATYYKIKTAASPVANEVEKQNAMILAMPADARNAALNDAVKIGMLTTKRKAGIAAAIAKKSLLIEPAGANPRPNANAVERLMKAQDALNDVEEILAFHGIKLQLRALYKSAVFAAAVRSVISETNLLAAMKNHTNVSELTDAQVNCMLSPLTLLGLTAAEVLLYMKRATAEEILPLNITLMEAWLDYRAFRGSQAFATTYPPFKAKFEKLISDHAISTNFAEKFAQFALPLANLQYKLLGSTRKSIRDELNDM